MKKISLLIISILLMLIASTTSTFATYTEDGYLYESFNISDKFLDTGLPQNSWTGDNYWGFILSSNLDSSKSEFGTIVPIKILLDNQGNPQNGPIQSDHNYYRISTFETPNYIVYPNGITETNVFDKVLLRFYTQKGTSQVVSSYDVELTNFGVGGKSKFYLEEPVIIPDVSSIKYVGIRYITTSAVKNAIVNNSNSNLSGSTSAARLKYFGGSLTASYSSAYVESQNFLKNNNYRSIVIADTRTEWNAPIENEDFDNLSSLPSSTRGTAFSNTKDMGKVNFLVDNNKLTARVQYDVNNDLVLDENEEWFIQFVLSEDTDMSKFNSSFETFYYVYEGQRYFLINHGKTSMFTSNNVRRQTWVDYTIWNLNTNEMNTFERMNVYVYSKLEESNNVYAYFYVDEFVIENLLSVTLAMKYRYTYLLGNPGEWKEYHKILEAGVTEAFDATSWQADFLTGTAVATTVLSFVPVVRWPALIIGTGLMAAVGSTIQDTPISFGDVQQIKQIYPTGDLLNELNNAYSSIHSGFNGIDNELSAYKLYLGQFNEMWSTGIDIDRNYSVYDAQKGINVVSFTYVTNGQVYTIQGQDIDMKFTPGTGTDGNNPGINIPLISGDIQFNVAAISFIVILVISLVNNKGGITNLKAKQLINAAFISLILSGLIYIVLGYVIPTLLILRI